MVRRDHRLDSPPEVVSSELIERSILLVRGHKVILDVDLARLYGVETKALNRAVTRNLDRFPHDFAFRRTLQEFESLRCQTGTSKLPAVFGPPVGRGGRRYLPFVFTEQGVAMLSSVLRSRRAVLVNVEIMRAFVRLRGMLAAHKDLAQKLDALEERYDIQFKVVFDAIRRLMAGPVSPRRRIGFDKGE